MFDPTDSLSDDLSEKLSQELEAKVMNCRIVTIEVVVC